jgi:hypothetical protein
MLHSWKWWVQKAWSKSCQNLGANLVLSVLQPFLDPFCRGYQFKRKYLVGLKPTLEVVEFSIQNLIHFFCCCCWLFFSLFFAFVWRWMESYGLSLPSVWTPWLLVSSWSILVANNVSLYYGCWEINIKLYLFAHSTISWIYMWPSTQYPPVHHPLETCYDWVVDKSQPSYYGSTW